VRRSVWLWILALLPCSALAEGFPNKPLRLVVPYAAGGATDTVARALSAPLGERLGQPVVVDNRTGGGGVIAGELVAEAAPDGHTLLIHLGPPQHTIQFFQQGVPYDPIADFTPIAVVATAPQAIAVGPALPEVKTLAQLIEYARAHPGTLSYGTSGVGSAQHLGGLLLNSAAGLDLVHVPYKGGAPALADALGGQIQLAIVSLSNVLPHLAGGQLRALAVLEAERTQTAPQIPTLAQAGLEGQALPATWVGVLGPKGMPAALVEQLYARLTEVGALPAVRERLEGAGFEVNPSSPQQFAAQIRESAALYQRLAAQAGIQPE
jgi:tripartite-type tricarboxylate transporter receptor subunit TctC